MAAPTADRAMTDFMARHCADMPPARRYEPVREVPSHDQMSDLVGRCPSSSASRRDTSTQQAMYSHMNGAVAQPAMVPQPYSMYSGMPQHAPPHTSMPVEGHTRPTAVHGHYPPVPAEVYHISPRVYSCGTENSQGSSGGQSFTHGLPADRGPVPYRHSVARPHDMDYHRGLVAQRHDYAMQYSARNPQQVRHILSEATSTYQPCKHQKQTPHS